MNRKSSSMDIAGVTPRQSLLGRTSHPRVSPSLDLPTNPTKHRNRWPNHVQQAPVGRERARERSAYLRSEGDPRRSRSLPPPHHPRGRGRPPEPPAMTPTAGQRRQAREGRRPDPWVLRRETERREPRRHLHRRPREHARRPPRVAAGKGRKGGGDRRR
jgi:hypothetical protein